MANVLQDLLGKVTDEPSFLRFLAALRADNEAHERDCRLRSWRDCAMADHWETKSIKQFLSSMESWGAGDFGDGLHGDEPLLRRFATMLYVGRGLRPEDR